ncbi:hypothetical protein GCM10010207_04020 [Streptomyces atratus]|nr:hypothetical protein GCM10010207_04020 [Streptomyces atratus]
MSLHGELTAVQHRLDDLVRTVGRLEWCATARRSKTAFAGPRFLMRIAELDMHPLDAAAESGLDRKATTREEHGLGYCNITKCLTEVRSEHIKITKQCAESKPAPVQNSPTSLTAGDRNLPQSWP